MTGPEPVRPPDVVAFAHGRVNLMGDHTDYNGGFVLPACIPQRTRVDVWRRADSRVLATSANLRSAEAGGPLHEGSAAFALDALKPTGHWSDYVKGVVDALQRAGIAVGGFDAHIDSNVPIGSGLSSSAALEVALLRALRTAFDLSLDDVRLAKLARLAETDFVGAPVGIMDQMVASVGNLGGALYLDTRSLAFEVIPLPAAAELVVLDSCVSHSHRAGGYSVRRAECDEARRLLGLRELTDLSWPEDEARALALPSPFDLRARHVITENARVHAAATALRESALGELGRLFFESHASLRDDFRVSVPAVDALVDAARADDDVYGARMTGGGFGGCVVALARSGTGRAVGERILHRVQAHGVALPRVVLPLLD
jgi:galactokinase